MTSAPQVRLRTILITALAVGASAAVAIPTSMMEPWKWLGPLWMYHATIALSNVAAWSACALAIVIAVKRARDDAAYSLALFLTLGAAGYGAWTAQATLAALHIVWVARAANAFMLVAFLFSTAAVLRFASQFPRPVLPEDIRKNFIEAGSITFKGFDDSWGTIAQRVKSKVEPTVTAASRRGALKKIRDRYLAYRLSSQAANRQYADRAMRFNGWIVKPGNVWRTAFLIAIPVTTCAAAGWTLGGAVLSAYPAMFAWVLSIAYMRMSYLTGNPAERGRALWVVEGFLLALAPCVIVETILFPLILVNIAVTPYFMSSYVLALSVGAFGLVACLGMATFHSGSFDSALVIRRTTVYSAMIVLLTSAFAVIENSLRTRSQRMSRSRRTRAPSLPAWQSRSHSDRCATG